MNHPDDECKGCGEKIADDFDLGFDCVTEYCSHECFEKRPLGTGYSRSDYANG